jgi:hypothetical protein
MEMIHDPKGIETRALSLRYQASEGLRNFRSFSVKGEVRMLYAKLHA